MDRISPLPPFGARTCCCLPAAALSRGFSGPQRRIQSIFQSFFGGEGGCQGSLTAVPEQQGDQEPPPAFPRSAQTFGSPYLLGRNFEFKVRFVFHPDRNKLLCNIQEVTFIRLDSIYKIKSMEKQILALDGKCWH